MSLAILQVLTPLVRYHGDVATDILGIIIVVQSRNCAVDTTLRLLGVLVLSVMLQTPCVEHTATTGREWNLPKAFATSCYIILTELNEVLLKRTQFAAAMGNHLFALLLSNLVHLLWSQVGILRQAIAVATQTVTTCIESQTGTQGLNKVLVYTLGSLGDSILLSPVAIVLSL